MYIINIRLASGDRSRKLAKLVAQVRRLRRLTHLTKFELILINKAVINCELDKFWYIYCN